MDEFLMFEELILKQVIKSSSMPSNRNIYDSLFFFYLICESEVFISFAGDIWVLVFRICTFHYSLNNGQLYLKKVHLTSST